MLVARPLQLIRPWRPVKRLIRRCTKRSTRSGARAPRPTVRPTRPNDSTSSSAAWGSNHPTPGCCRHGDAAARPPIAHADRIPRCPCAGQRINAIVVRSYAPTVAVFNKVPVLARCWRDSPNDQPVRHPPFLLLREGDRCNELRRAESERILRAQPFIAYAVVRPLADSGGGVVLDVRTTDELAIVVASRPERKPVVRLLRLGDANVAGEGIYLREIGETEARFATASVPSWSTTNCSVDLHVDRRRPSEPAGRGLANRCASPVLH